MITFVSSDPKCAIKMVYYDKVLYLIWGTPNQRLACFVFDFKVINTIFFKKIVLEAQKWH